MERISDEIYRRIRADARVALQPLFTDAGGVQMPIVGYLVSAARAE